MYKIVPFFNTYSAPPGKTAEAFDWEELVFGTNFGATSCQDAPESRIVVSMLLDRDLNAANILSEGLKIISAGTSDYMGGDGVSLSNKRLSVKPEAQPISFAVGLLE